MNPSPTPPPTARSNQHGGFNPPITTELLYDLRDLASWGVGFTEAADRVGYSSRKALDKALRRHYARHPRTTTRIRRLLGQLVAQDYVSVTTHDRRAS